MNIRSLWLWPCSGMVWLAGLFVPAACRAEWKREWQAEIWHRRYQYEMRGEMFWTDWVEIYRNCSGILPDAWWYFQNDDERRNRILEQLRSPRFCLLFLTSLLIACVVGSGFVPVTRKVFLPQLYLKENRIAVISRTGRLEPIRRGIPPALARTWQHQSHLLEGMAQCSFPRRISVAFGNKRGEALLLQSTGNLLPLLGLPAAFSFAGPHRVFVSYDFWKTQLQKRPNIIGQRLAVNETETVVAGILPKDFWFLSPAVAFYQPDLDTPRLPGMLVVRRRPGVTARQLEAELEKTANNSGYEFTRTAPHAMILRDAVQTPLLLFAAALIVALVLVGLAHGSRWMRGNGLNALIPKRSIRRWGFFVLKTALALMVILVLGLEMLVPQTQQIISDSLGGPVLFWFYIVSCSLVLFASVSDQHARCRVCQRLLALPIRIGCPGCLLLDWSGTEFLCTQGHGMLYVPHHVSCWEEADRWVRLAQ